MSYRGYDELRRGLVLHLPLSEGVGTSVKDTSLYRNNGTFAGDPSWVEGRAGRRALSFDGVNDRVSIPDDDSLDITGDLTLGYGFKLTSSANGTIMPLIKSASYILGFSAWRIYFNFFSAGAWRGATLSAAFAEEFLKNRHLYTATYNQGEGIVRLYIDEKKVADKNIGTHIINPTSNPINIGKNWSEGWWDPFVLDEIRVYKHILDTIEIRNLSNLRGLI